MIGVILIAHMRTASETKATVEYILQEQCAFEAVDVINSDAAHAQSQALEVSLQTMSESCEAILVMTDIFGATPCNIAMNVIVQGDFAADIELVAGFNIPCVIKAILERNHHDVKTLAQLSLDAGQKYMRLGSQEAVVKQLFSKSKAA